ncbi:hypothetical protein ZIOFF_069130 [Zingiber officinale]|uniref:OTU domain-containing protein n=1 Tax=Zingiber officinale TaxID=94328 RepID=A0A8J5CDA1_ZINOF|nr:hypothetical protein ZIOFF_069130 [Zingiber officinale]
MNRPVHGSIDDRFEALCKIELQLIACKTAFHLPTVKKHGKQTDIEEFRVQLDVLGLKIVEVTADGNCFFRALADQLHGNEDEHQKFREMVVKYIMVFDTCPSHPSNLVLFENHREDFEPFIEDEVPFDEYCRTMEKDGTWAGNMELQAASLVTRRNICIHRFSSPRWYISNFSGHQDDMIHLCYHDGEHYNSVRLKEDSCEGPARPIIIKVDAHISRKDHDDKATTNKSSKGSSCRSFNRESVKLVMMGTGCKDVDKVEQVLQEVDGDVDAAIEFLIAEQDMDLHENAQSSNDRSMENDLVQGNELSEFFWRRPKSGTWTARGSIRRLKDCSRKSKMKCQACFSSTGKTSPSVYALGQFQFLKFINFLSYVPLD